MKSAARTEVVNEGVVAFTSGSLPRRWFVKTVLRRKLFGREVWIELRWRRV